MYAIRSYYDLKSTSIFRISDSGYQPLLLQFIENTGGIGMILCHSLRQFPLTYAIFVKEFIEDNPLFRVV